MQKEEMEYLTEIAKKDPLVKKLFDFYSSTTMDGVKAIRVTLNSELIKLNSDLSKPDTNYDFVLDRISEIARTLKKLPKDESTSEAKKSVRQEDKASNGKKKTVFDAEIDKSRQS